MIVDKFANAILDEIELTLITAEFITFAVITFATIFVFDVITLAYIVFD